MFPKVLKNINLFNEANSLMGEVKQMTVPKIVQVMEAIRNGGMIGAIEADMGIETPEFEWTLGGHNALVFRQAGIVNLNGALLRAVGAFQSDADSSVTAVEAVMRGRHKEIDPGTWEPGKASELKVKTTCTYYKLTENGTELFEIDLLNSVYRVGGVDRYAAIRAALGG